MAFAKDGVARASRTPTDNARIRSSVYDADDESRSFLQRRLSTFSGVAAGLSTLFLMYRMVATLWHPEKSGDGSAALWLHASGSAVFAGLFLLVRLGPISIDGLRRAEAATLVLSATAFSFMAATIQPEATPEMIVVLALSLCFFARATYVPSTGRRTLFLGVAVALPIAVATAYIYAQPDADAYMQKAIEVTGRTRAEMLVSKVADIMAWWTMVVVVGALASRIVYGLRQEVRGIRRLGQYQLGERLGEGGMGVVFMGRHALLERATAVKLLPPDRLGEVSIARFEREVRLTSRLRHPSTITIYDYGRTPDGVFFYAMELIDGATLAEVVHVGGPQPASRVVAILTQAAGALVEAHGAGLIHRDLKPQNVMVHMPHAFGHVREVAKVLDFGLVQELSAPSTSEEAGVRGTPMYLAPELALDPGAASAQSDIYALGAVAYYLLTGTHVFTATTIIGVLRKHIDDAPDPPSQRVRAAVDPDLEALILHCLAKDPLDRPATAATLLERLENLASKAKLEWTAREARQWWDEHGPVLVRERQLRANHQAGQATILKSIQRRRRTDSDVPWSVAEMG